MHIFPMREGSCDTRERTIKRYGPPFLADMESLQAGNDTLTAVGEKIRTFQGANPTIIQDLLWDGIHGYCAKRN